MVDNMRSLLETSLLDGDNQAYLEMQYESYLNNSESVSQEWRHYFDSMLNDEVIGVVSKTSEPIHSDIRNKLLRVASKSKAQAGESVDFVHERKQMKVQDLIHNYRLLGHLHSDINPLGTEEKFKVPELELEYYGLSAADLSTLFNAGGLLGTTEKRSTLKNIMARLKKIYCGTIATEYMHIADATERAWFKDKVEAKLHSLNLNKEVKHHILQGIIAAEGLETYLAKKYPGAKRFGLEGSESLIVALDTIVQHSASQGVQEVVIGMAHRGRLNVLVNILGKRPGELFDEFEGKYNNSVTSGDVKYHQGFSSDVKVADGYMHLSLAFNPSHLEVVSAVINGSVCARQQRRKGVGKAVVLPIAVHGDSAFSGQGIVMENFNMSQTRGYGVGGTIHIIINNQIGFTTSNLKDLRSTLYCSDLGKMVSAPILHVNADDPEAVFAATEIAFAYRNKFFKDIIIDLICYRRHGHNEADEPAVTQPYMYQKIRNLKSVTEIYADKLLTQGDFPRQEIDKLIADYRESLDKKDRAVARHLAKDNWRSEYATDWTPYTTCDWRAQIPTAVPIEKLKALAKQMTKVPADFSLHSLVKKIIDNRNKMTAEELAVDWGYAENLAYASLLAEGYTVRLSGQDCRRGTFFHRHAVWHDQNSADIYTSLNHLSPNQGKFWVIDSVLSEAAVLAFDYGYSTSEPKALVIWEAQFGDFANNAQVVIDQFISSAEQKWGRLSGLVMFLPHGYEGQGPEHSSARLERYLQLCAQNNIQVCVPSTPAQVFHLLRRQILRPMRKPLIVMTPKSLLRHKQAVSTLEELAQGKFHPLLVDDDSLEDKDLVSRVILCSGKVYYELNAARDKQNRSDVAIIRIEQLYPFPEEELKSELESYMNAKTVVWCQEESKNQGAWYSSQHHFKQCLRQGQTLEYAGREPSAAPAVGHIHLHVQQQQKLIEDALGTNAWNFE